MQSRARLVSFVVPTYNERQNLPRLVEAIRRHVRRSYEIIVVDDSSPDGTGDLARDLARTHPIRVITRPRKSGLGSAYREGFRAARGDVIFEMDADLSHDPRHVQALVEALEKGAAVAVGSRYVAGGGVAGWGPYRRLVSWGGNTLARAVLGLRVRDVTSGYRCYAREHAHVVQAATSDGYAFQVEVLYLARRLGLQVAEVPIRFENRTAGRSKLDGGELTQFLATLARLRVAGPARVGSRRVPAKT